MTKIEINVFTEDNVKQAPYIDLNSSNEALGINAIMFYLLMLISYSD